MYQVSENNISVEHTVYIYFKRSLLVMIFKYSISWLIFWVWIYQFIFVFLSCFAFYVLKVYEKVYRHHDNYIDLVDCLSVWSVSLSLSNRYQILVCLMLIWWHMILLLLFSWYRCSYCWIDLWQNKNSFYQLI